MLHGAERELFDLTFKIPSECARLLASGEVDIGIVSSIEVPRQKLEILPGVGICSKGPVRSILLVSKVPTPKIRTFAADSSSRTSVVLAHIILSRRYGVSPKFVSQEPTLASMLENADAALIIGDPALHLDPTSLPFHVLDLGREWTDMTELPMVYAVWAGRSAAITPDLPDAFCRSYRFGADHLDDILRLEAEPRGFPVQLAREYLTRHISFELGVAEREGLSLFFRYAAEGGWV